MRANSWVRRDRPVLFFVSKKILSVPCFNVNELKDCQSIAACHWQGTS